MKQTLRTFKLQVSNNFKEELFISQYGQALFDFLRKNAFIIDKGRCAGCGHEPPDHRKNDCLTFHICEINRSKPEETKGVTLCKSCHATQHIENSIKNGWILFVNSIHDQSNLVRLSRANQIHGAISQRNIIILKKTPEQFLQEWASNGIKITTSLKVIFTNTFIIDDLY